MSSRSRSTFRRHTRLGLLVSLCAMLGVLLAAPGVALAHPLDEYLQATYITVAPAQVIVELDMTPGVLVAPQVLSVLDADGDQQISDAEGEAYAADVLRELSLQVDGKSLGLAVTKVDMPSYLTLQAGYGTLRIFTTADLAEGMTGTHTVAFQNNFAPVKSSYQVNAFVDKGVPVTLGKQNRDSIQQSMTMDYAIASAVPAATLVASAPAESSDAALQPTTSAVLSGTLVGNSAQAQQLLGYLSAPVLDPWVLVLALSLSLLLGGLHALTPGHGKTLVAAYLVGSRGTVTHAVTLGSIVTFTHTSSVIAIGLLALFASQFIVPDVLVPGLEIIAGLLVVVMGIRLVVQRWGSFQEPTRAHNHPTEHSVEHSHAHEHNGHAHGFTHDHGDGHFHTHLPPPEGVSFKSLVAMGISGGLVPCPEALGIMVIAIGLNRILLGLGMIVSFSFGLAAVLILIGVLLVRSRSLVERVGGAGSRWTRAIPLLSAIIVTALGAAITLSALVTLL